MIYCFDIDGSLTDHPVELGELMAALTKAGQEVHVLSGHKGETVPDDVIRFKEELLEELGVKPYYSVLAVVAAPNGDVSAGKVAYMQTVGAAALLDNNRHNVKAVQKAGLTAIRVYKRKKRKPLNES